MDLPKGQLPAGLHLRFGGIQILTLTQVKLGTSGFQELGSLKQLQQLTLSDTDGHFAAIGSAVVQHFKMNISRAGKLKHAEADRTKVQLMAAMPYSDKRDLQQYVYISQHSVACCPHDQAGSATGSTAGHGPFTSGSDAHGHERASPFAMLGSLTSLTLHQYPLACLPAQDLAVCSQCSLHFPPLLSHCSHLHMFTDALLAELHPCRINSTAKSDSCAAWSLLLFLYSCVMLLLPDQNAWCLKCL